MSTFPLRSKPNPMLVNYAWVVLGYTVLVILWGAFVRATSSGAGCGSHWPLCNGEVFPRSPGFETLIELVHRLSSGLLGLAVLALLVFVFRVFPIRHPARKAACWTVFLVTVEAIIGAGLVRFEWVADNDSVERVYTMVFHFANTFLLLAAMVLTGWLVSGGTVPFLRNQGQSALAVGLALMGVLVVGSGGAVTALGDTLYLTEGLSPQDSPVVAGLLQSRYYHPAAAILVFFLVSWSSFRFVAARPSEMTRRLAYSTVGLYGLQLIVGALNVYLKAPIWIQLVHLLVADVIWITLVLLAISGLSVAPREPVR